MRRQRDHAEAVDESFWGRPTHRFPLTGSFVVDGLALVLGALVVATLVGLALLWPHGKLEQAGRFGPIRTVGAVAEQVQTVPCAISASQSCRIVHVKLLDGPQKGRKTMLATVASVGSLDVSEGDRIRAYKNALPPGSATTGGRNSYSFADFDRRGAMLWLSIGFVVLLLATGRLHGLRALLGLIVSFVIVVEFIVPAILHGSSPLAVAVVGAFAVMLVMMPLSYGLGAKAMAAWLGTAVSLLVAAGIASAFARIAHLSGAASDESVYLGSAATRRPQAVRAQMP